jgi:hypothetical protein
LAGIHTVTRYDFHSPFYRRCIPGHKAMSVLFRAAVPGRCGDEGGYGVDVATGEKMEKSGADMRACSDTLVLDIIVILILVIIIIIIMAVSHLLGCWIVRRRRNLNKCSL